MKRTKQSRERSNQENKASDRRIKRRAALQEEVSFNEATKRTKQSRE
jgi:hypothetical protein